MPVVPLKDCDNTCITNHEVKNLKTLCILVSGGIGMCSSNVSALFANIQYIFQTSKDLYNIIICSTV